MTHSIASSTSTMLTAEFDIDILIEDSKWHNFIQHYNIDAQAQQIFTRVIDYLNLQFNTPSIEISIVLTNNDAIQILNHAYRQKNKPTNVLSFGQYDDHQSLISAPSELPVMLGDIVIAWETLTVEAENQGKLFDHHFTHILMHGFIHLLGYDHDRPSESELFEQIEIAVLKQLKITNPYEGIDD